MLSRIHPCVTVGGMRGESSYRRVIFINRQSGRGRRWVDDFSIVEAPNVDVQQSTSVDKFFRIKQRGSVPREPFRRDERPCPIKTNNAFLATFVDCVVYTRTIVNLTLIEGGMKTFPRVAFGRNENALKKKYR